MSLCGKNCATSRCALFLKSCPTSQGINNLVCALPVFLLSKRSLDSFEHCYPFEDSYHSCNVLLPELCSGIKTALTFGGQHKFCIKGLCNAKRVSGNQSIFKLAKLTTRVLFSWIFLAGL